MDILSNFCESNYGHRHLLVVVDELTRFVEIFLLKHKTAEEVAIAYFNGYICRYGAPEVLITDNGYEFVNRTMQCLADVMGIKKVSIIPYRPQANGLCERANRKVIEALRMAVGGDDPNWDRYLPQVQHSINAMFSDTIGMSPNEALLGYPAQGALDLLLIPTDDEIVKSLISTAKERYARLAKNLEMKTRDMVDRMENEPLVKDFQSMLELKKLEFEELERIRAHERAMLGMKLELAKIQQEFARVKQEHFDDWLKSRQVTTLAALKELILIEDFKNRVLKDLRVHLEDLKVTSFPELLNRGTNFTSKYFQDRCAELAIQHITSVPYHPESQGVVERFHQTLKSIIAQVRGVLLVLVKKPDGDYRMCVDYRRVNQVTKSDSFPLPRIEDLIDRIGMPRHYRRFVKNFADIAQPLTNLLKKNTKFLWSTECEKAFNKLKSVLVSEPILSSPNFNKPFVLAVDASDVGIGGVLFQRDDKEMHPVSYFSKSYFQAERKYSTIEKEALALVKSISHFSIYLSSSLQVEVLTDHNPLVFINKMKGANQRILRWALLLQEYNLVFQHIKGVDNKIPDALSRM
ncbi:uncharacterized protein [Macrobrachium rosenbergii]|uniref:uncharacterized protein n=1 Tax=Macrobrachium rosenbergii TaxID=79674 RepID=UPI0034D48233